ncbi:hypothetical protein LQZ18_09345 [Lachnospiraceae bacterium ZAX-1]
MRVKRGNGGDIVVFDLDDIRISPSDRYAKRKINLHTATVKNKYQEKLEQLKFNF